MNTVDEKANTLSRTGSFYCNGLTAKSKRDAELLSHLSYRSRALQQLANAHQAVLSGGYFDDHHKVIRFTDANIIYFGAYSAYQKRVIAKVKGKVGSGRPELLRWSNAFFGYINTNLEDFLFEEAAELPLLAEETQRPLESEQYEESDDGALGAKEFYNTSETGGNRLPILFPGVGTQFVQAATAPIFGLTVGDDILVHTIRLKNGETLVRGVDFNAYYGLVVLKANPVVLFSGMKFMAASYTQRRRNLMCYTLGVDYVCGPVDRVLRYYRDEQSPMAFYRAAAQACGMAVIRNTTKVADIVRMYSGVSYIMENGDRYDACYPHEKLKVGDVLHDGQVIGGDTLFNVILPGNNEAYSLERIKLKKSVPVPGIVVINSVGNLFGNDGVFQPTVSYDSEEGTPSSPASYLKYLRELGLRDEDGPATGNVLKYFLNNILGNKYIILRINRAVMPKEMLMRLTAFVERESPVGGVLLEADM